MSAPEGKHLGKQIAYPGKYCKDILVAVPRILNRDIYDIPAENFFYGFDCWHAWEAGFLQDNGMPITGVLKIVYPSSSFAIVESKSLKLYLGSYNMEKMGNSRKSAIENFEKRVATDLSALLDTSVKAHFFPEDSTFVSSDFKEYVVLEEEDEYVEIKDYFENPGLLTENIQISASGEMKVCSHLLRSNCKITNQPDWGTIFIRIKGKRLPFKTSLLKYIISLRTENHFHEEICEMVYKRLLDAFSPELITISCLYTRRGGIDICPTRSNKKEVLPPHLTNPFLLSARTLRQ